MGLLVKLPGTPWPSNGDVVNLDQSDSSGICTASDWHNVGKWWDRFIPTVIPWGGSLFFLFSGSLELFKFLFLLRSCFLTFSLSLKSCLIHTHTHTHTHIHTFPLTQQIILCYLHPKSLNGFSTYPPLASCFLVWELWKLQQCIAHAETQKLFN